MPLHTSPRADPRPAAGRGLPRLARPGLVGLVGLGGGLGTLSRWSLEAALGGADGWPWVTFALNLSGAFALGALLAGLAGGPDTGWRQALRLGIGTGILGGYTTYSSFAVQTVELARDGQAGLALGYALVSALAGVGCAAAGGGLVRTLRGLR